MTHAGGQASWWLARMGDMLLWARLHERADGTAEVLAADGSRAGFADAERARAMLLDADYRALDGLDDADARALGLPLAQLEPPTAASERELLPRLSRKLGGA